MKQLKTVELSAFKGSEKLYAVQVTGRNVLLYTEGVKYLAERGDCYWLLDIIVSYQGKLPVENQVWELMHDKNKIFVKCSDEKLNVLISQEIELSGFALDSLKLYLTKGVLMLQGEINYSFL
ncbi:MAG: hypothetical protein HOP30_10185 [Cyclobacteriaceae bacterium]|nr:hypothetical protein [Cyclobacteriaceae bacterium]